ncbi:MAG: SAM-dependent methyltransferase [Firmicutes bacterium]|nr:SAM-dependent methyltransferase [Bacillota bacterium]
MNEITRTLLTAMNSDGAAASGSLVKIVFADKRRKSIEYKKVTLRPVSIRGEYMYQAEFHFDNKVTHKNIPYYEGVDFAEQLILEDFKQINILTEHEDIQILASKPEKPRITSKPAERKAADLSHDRHKSYVLEDGKPCDFLIELGVMSEDGKVFKQHYAKFRQINRFLEIADNCFDVLPSDGRLRIIDFGCGKSYLTFALYYYLKLLRGRDVEIIGLDLKDDVIRFCNATAKKLGYDDLRFLTGDIADYESDGADMVATLHACDTATDFALINAVRWNSRVILSVPCCQHELFSQIHEPVNDPMLKHGIIKDKFTELLTDALRGLKLEAAGYDVKMIEFTSLEHTSKNIMIKAVLDPKPAAMKKASREYEALKEFYHVSPTIDGLV